MDKTARPRASNYIALYIISTPTLLPQYMYVASTRPIIWTPECIYLDLIHATIHMLHALLF